MQEAVAKSGMPGLAAVAGGDRGKDDYYNWRHPVLILPRIPQDQKEEKDKEQVIKY